MWGKADYLELAFYPTSTRLLGNLFWCLHFYREDQIPLERQQTHPGAPVEYRSAHASEWTTLESTLVSVRNILQHQRTVDVLVSLEKKAIPGPVSDRYDEWVIDPTEARRRAYYARRKFLYHISMISWHIAAISYRTRDPHRWQDILLQDRVPGHIVDSLASSVIGDFSPNTPRAGVFVDPSSCSWKYHLPVLIAASVPVYLSWGPEGRVFTCDAEFEKFLPTLPSIATAPRLPQVLPGITSVVPPSSSQQPSPPPRHSTAAHRSPVVSAESRRHNALVSGPILPRESLPKRAPFMWKGHTISSGEVGPSPPKFSPGMSPGEFFARRAMYREVFIRDMENERQKFARLDREKNATRYQVSQNGQDEVFEWDFDYNTMQWKRERVVRKERETVWSAYDPACMRYDPVTREWDVAYFLDYSAPRAPLEEYDRVLADEDDAVEHELATWNRRPLSPFFREQDYCLNPPDPDMLGNDVSFVVNTALGPDAISGAPMLATLSSRNTAPGPNTATTVTPSTTATVQLTPGGEDGQLLEHEWTPQIPDFLGVLYYRHAFRFGQSTVSASKRVTLVQACKAVGFFPSSDTKAVLETSTKSEGFTNWVSAIADNAVPPADWWLLNRLSASRLTEALRLSNLTILPIRGDGQGATMLWSLRDKRSSKQGTLRWFIAVQNPSTALEAALSYSSIDEAARWMVTFGMGLYNRIQRPRIDC